MESEIQHLEQQILLLNKQLKEEKYKNELLTTEFESYKLITENISDVIWVFDLEKQGVSYISASSEQVYGYTPAEFMQLPLSEVMPEASLIKMGEFIEERLALFLTNKKEEVKRDLLEFYTKDGRILWMEISSYYRTNKHTGKIEVLGCSRNVTEKVQSEKESKDLESLLEDAATLANMGSWEYKLDKQLFKVSPQWLSIYGIEASSFDGKWESVFSMIHPDDAEAQQELSKKSFELKTIITSYFRIIRSDNKVRYIKSQGKMEVDKSGDIKKIFGFILDVTEEVEAKNVMADYEAKLETVLNSSLDLILAIDKNYNLTLLNNFGKEIFKNIFGVALKTGDNILSILPDFMALDWKAQYDRAFKGENFLIEDAYEQAGVVYYSEVSFNPIYVDGKINGVSVYSRDITSKKLAALEVEKEKRKLNNIIEGTSAVTWTWKMQTNELELSTRWVEFIGHSLEEFEPFSPQVWAETVHPDDLNEANLKMKAHLKGESDYYDAFFRQKHKMGHWVWVNARGKITERDAQGNPILLSGIQMDVSELKNAEMALKESEERFRAFMQKTPAFAYIKDKTLKHIYFNQEIEKNFDQEILQKEMHSAQDAFSPEIALKLENADKEILAGKTDHLEVEIEIVKEGKPMWYRDIKFAINLPNGERAVGGLAFDVTQLIQYQKELEKYKNELENLVHERTMELESANEELNASNEELTSTNEILYQTNTKIDKQKNELELAIHQLKETQSQLIEVEKMASVGILTAGIAHEINNPLNFIKGGVVAIESYISSNLEEHKDSILPLIEMVNIGVNRTSAIVKSLNRFNRTNEKHNELCDIHNIVDDCLVMLQNQSKYKVEIEKNYLAEQYTLMGNEGKLHQVFLNILANSIQAIEDTGEIKIRTHVEKGKFIISIKDTGSGISSENLKKVIDPFFTTKAPGKGTGLGLSITYTIIKEHNGNFIIESELGKGTTVTICLPVM